MTFLEKIQRADFWINFIKVAVPFLIIVTIISIVFNSGGSLFTGDFDKVNEVNFSNGKWKRFWLTKIVISFLYGMYVTNKNQK